MFLNVVVFFFLIWERSVRLRRVLVFGPRYAVERFRRAGTWRLHRYVHQGPQWVLAGGCVKVVIL